MPIPIGCAVPERVSLTRAGVLYLIGCGISDENPALEEEEIPDASASMIPSTMQFVRSSSPEANPFQIQRQININERKKREREIFGRELEGGGGGSQSSTAQGKRGKKKAAK